MEGIIKLFPSTDTGIVIDSIVKLKNIIYIVTEILDHDLIIIKNETRELTISKYKVTLMKYYVVSPRNIIGQLNYADYKDVEEDMSIDYTSRTIFNKPNVGDEVTVDKYKFDNYHKDGYISKNGIIIDVCGIKAIIQLYDGEEIVAVRHQYKLKYDNYKTICTKI